MPEFTRIYYQSVNAITIAFFVLNIANMAIYWYTMIKGTIVFTEILFNLTIRRLHYEAIRI